VQDEISEMKRKFKIMSHQIEQLKEEIAAKDLALVKEHFDHMKVGADQDCIFCWLGGTGLPLPLCMEALRQSHKRLGNWPAV
jgi:hypothetical protein